MIIEQLVENPVGTLMCHIMPPYCVYSPIKGAITRNNVCIVSPVINKVGCSLKGTLRQAGEIRRYDTVIFLSKVSVNLSQIVNQNIKEVVFCNDADINVDIDPSSFPTILTAKLHSNVHKLCVEKGFNYKKLYPFRMS